MEPPRFSLSDAERVQDEWGANCGPGAVAAICGLTLDELRPHMAASWPLSLIALICRPNTSEPISCLTTGASE